MARNKLKKTIDRYDSLPVRLAWMLRNHKDIKDRALALADKHHKDYMMLRREYKLLKKRFSELPESVLALERMRKLLKSHNQVYVFYSKNTGKFKVFTYITDDLLESGTFEMVGTYANPLPAERFFADSEAAINAELH